MPAVHCTILLRAAPEPFWPPPGTAWFWSPFVFPGGAENPDPGCVEILRPNPDFFPYALFSVTGGASRCSWMPSLYRMHFWLSTLTPSALHVAVWS